MNRSIALHEGGAIEGSVIPRIRQIITHEQAADALDSAADAHRWEAARLIAEELAAGKSQRQLAAEIGKSQAHVSFMARTWRDYHGNQVRPAFAEAYQALKARPAAIEAPKMSPEEARARTERLRTDCLMMRCALRAGLLSGVAPIEAARMLNRLQARAEHQWAEAGIPRDHVDLMSRFLLRPLLDAALAWPEEDLLLPHWEDSPPPYEPCTDAEETEVRVELRRFYRQWFEPRATTTITE